MDLIGNGVSFKEFATQKNPQTEGEKHLVAALWIAPARRPRDLHDSQRLYLLPHDGLEHRRRLRPADAADEKDKSYYSTPKFGLWKLTATPGMDAANAIGNQ